MSVFIATGRVLIRCSHHNVQLGRGGSWLVLGATRRVGEDHRLGQDETLRLMGHGV